MPLLAYTTTVPVDRTLAEIQRILSSHGARRVLIDYDGQGTPVALLFLVPTAFGERGFRLPARIEAVQKVLTRQAAQRKIPRRFANDGQAQRVGWRIIREWLAAQMAIVETEMVAMTEIFLPYMVHQSSRTLYEIMVEERLALPAPRERNEEGER